MPRLGLVGVYTALCGAQGLAFGLAATLHTVYKIEDLRLGPLQIVLLAALTEVVILLCEVPTGVLADTIGRRFSVVLGLALNGAAWLIIGSSTELVGLAVGAVVWGLAETFGSGAREAWVADEIEPGASASAAFAQGAEAGMAARFVGTWLAAGIGIWAGNAAPMLAAGVVFLLLAVLAGAVMSERGFRRPKEAGMTGAMDTLREGLRLARTSRSLGAVLTAALIFAAACEGFDRLWQQVLIDGFSPLPSFFGLESKLWWAALNSGALLTGAAMVVWLRKSGRMESEARVKRSLGWITVGLVAGLAAFAFAASFWWGAAAFLFVRTLRRASDPLFTAWVNHNARPEVRATVLSFHSQAHSMGELGGGPLLGWVGEFSLRWSMAISAALLAPVGLAFRDRRK